MKIIDWLYAKIIIGVWHLEQKLWLRKLFNGVPFRLKAHLIILFAGDDSFAINVKCDKNNSVKFSNLKTTHIMKSNHYPNVAE